MRVLVIGATGFTGSHVVPLLAARRFQVRCLVRSTSNLSVLPTSQVEITRGDLEDEPSLERALIGMDALVNLASLGFGHAPNIVAAALKAGVRRALFMSTTAIFTSLNTSSKSIRIAAEETVRSSGLDHTILRPTMIYGTARDRNMSRLIRYLNRWPVIPVFGNGKGILQPVHVADVAAAVLGCLDSADSINKAYNIAGESALCFDRMIELVCSLMNRRVTRIHLPDAPIASILAVFERFSIRLPIKAEQILRLSEDKSFDYSAAASDFGYHPISFADGIRRELRAMALA